MVLVALAVRKHALSGCFFELQRRAYADKCLRSSIVLSTANGFVKCVTFRGFPYRGRRARSYHDDNNVSRDAHFVGQLLPDFSWPCKLSLLFSMCQLGMKRAPIDRKNALFASPWGQLGSSTQIVLVPMRD